MGHGHTPVLMPQMKWVAIFLNSPFRMISFLHPLAIFQGTASVPGY